MKTTTKKVNEEQYTGFVECSTYESRTLTMKGYVSDGKGFYYKKAEHKTEEDKALENEHRQNAAPAAEASVEAQPDVPTETPAAPQPEPAAPAPDAEAERGGDNADVSPDNAAGDTPKESESTDAAPAATEGGEEKPEGQ